jgi:hypothetical protein
VTETSAGEFSVSGTHTYNKGGNFTTLVTITDGASIVSETTVLKVTKTTFSGTLGAVPLPIPGLPLSDFVGTIAWGDGTSSAALMSLMSGDGIDFSGNHTYDKTGTYTATLQLKGGYMVSAKSTATVNAAGGTISGTVFNDANGNGARNTGEGGVANRVIYIDSNKDGILDNNELHTTTDAAGNWSFTGLAAGTYRIREQNIAGVRHTDPPGNSNYYDLKVTTGSVIQGILFGDQVYTPNPAPILAINAGGPSFVLNSGITYSADTGFTGGTATTTVLDVGNTDNDPIYYSYRSGTSFSYSLAVPNGAYNLVLNFVDPTSTAAGQRKFNVTVEGKQVLTNFDIFAAAGPKTAISKAFAVTVTGGKLTLSLKSVVGNAILSGIVLYPT